MRVGSWDTGRVESGDSLFVPYAGPALQPRTAYRVQVEVWDNHGQTACAETGVETGLRGPDGFAAQWIADPFEGEHPLPVFETEFAIDTPVKTARLYIMAHGIYEAELDGAKLGDAWFAPGWTSYHKRLQYQTIPVDTARLTPGRHTLHVTVANGWYKGALGFVPRPNHYGDRAALLAMLCLDGRTVATGEGWRVTTGPVQRAEFYYGEDYDAAAPAAAPRPPLLPGLDKKNLIAQEDEPVRCVQMLPVVKDFLAPNGEWVLDFGQNITGVVHAKLDLPAGAQVRLRHAESLDENGNFYTGNLSFAKSEDTFRSAGQPAEYLPRFTYHGFRYLCVEGLPESQRDPAAFTACVLTTDLRRTGQFRCSDERVNQLQSNIQWSQQDNFLEVPTDCPQRSERLGWTGDIRLQQEIEMPGADLPAPAWQAGSWYETLQGLPTDDEFAALYGSPLQDDPPLEPGRFSMEDSIMEMKDFSPLMMQAFRGTEATIAQGFGGKADYSNPDFRMMIMSGADAPLRAAVLSSGGSFPAAAAQGLLAAANGQTDGPA